MRCPECELDAMVMGSRREVEGDQSPNTQTKVFTVLDFQCRNPQCKRCGKRIGEAKFQIYPEGGETNG